MPAPKRFRKKALEVEAVQWTGGNREEVEAFVGAGYPVATGPGKHTFFGTMLAAPGDRLVRDPNGAVTVCPPKQFEATYEPATSGPDLETAVERLLLERASDENGDRFVPSGADVERLTAKITRLFCTEPAPLQKDGGEGHRVEIEFDGFYPSVKLIHPEGGCSLPDACCESCGRDLREPDAESCDDCMGIVPGYCALTDWVEAEGHELVRGKITLPFRTEWTDYDHPLLHLAASTQPASPSEEGVVNRLPWRDYTLVTLPTCASESGVPRAGVIGGFHADAFTHDRETLVRCALAQLRKNCIEHHGRDLLPDADNPSDANWYVLCIEKESAVYSLHYKGPAPASPSPVESDWPEVTMVRCAEHVRAGNSSPEVQGVWLADNPLPWEGATGYETRRYVPATSDKEAGEVEG